MSKNTLSALNMPEHQKRQTVAAVYEALGILNQRAKSARECWSETWKISKRITKHTITMVNNSQKYTGVWVSLIVGSSQQRRLKRFNRRSDVWIKSRRIADQTGANFDEVKDLYFELMNQYIADDL